MSRNQYEGDVKEVRWQRQLRSYANLPGNSDYWPKPYICPNATLAFSTALISQPDRFSLPCSYGLNREGFPSYAEHAAGAYRGIRNTQINRPSVKIAQTDATDWMVCYERANKANYYDVRGEQFESSSYNNVPAYRHSARLNRPITTVTRDRHHSRISGMWRTKTPAPSTKKNGTSNKNK